MPSKRTPINRAGKRKITPEAVNLFRQMLALEEKCTCPPIDWAGKYWENREQCKACEKWWALNSFLHRELHLSPWQWPAYQCLDWVTPYPEGSPAAERDKPDLDGQERFRMLAEAAGIEIEAE